MVRLRGLLLCTLVAFVKSDENTEEKANADYEHLEDGESDIEEKQVKRKVEKDTSLLHDQDDHRVSPMDDSIAQVLTKVIQDAQGKDHCPNLPCRVRENSVERFFLSQHANPCNQGRC